MTDGDGRKHMRRDSSVATTCTSQGHTWHVDVCNVSAGGCLVEAEGLALQQDALARLRIEDIGTIDGKVIWVDGHRAGLSFDEDLHEAVVRYVARRTNAAMGRDVTPRDRFGRALPTPQYPGRFGDILRG